MSRETKTIETPVGKQKVVIKTWLTGRERRATRAPFYEGMKLNIKEGDKTEVQPKENMASVVTKLEDTNIEIVVISIDEDKKDILNKVLDMCEKDFGFIIKEISKVVNAEDF